MTEKQETLLETINKLKSDVDKGKEKSAQQKAHIRDLQQVCLLSVRLVAVSVCLFVCLFACLFVVCQIVSCLCFSFDSC